MDFDTDFWSEIQDAPGEIFDIPELWDGEEEEQSWQQFLESDVTLWQLALGGWPSPQSVLHYLCSQDTHPMADTLSKQVYRQLFTEDQWDLIYNFIGNALDDDLFNPEDVYAIRNKIHALFDEEDWW